MFAARRRDRCQYLSSSCRHVMIPSLMIIGQRCCFLCCSGRLLSVICDTVLSFTFFVLWFPIKLLFLFLFFFSFFFFLFPPSSVASLWSLSLVVLRGKRKRKRKKDHEFSKLFTNTFPFSSCPSPLWRFQVSSVRPGLPEVCGTLFFFFFPFLPHRRFSFFFFVTILKQRQQSFQRHSV